MNEVEQRQSRLNPLLILVCGIAAAIMLAQVLYLSFKGLQGEVIFFWFVELVPLAVMSIAYWVGRLFRKN